MEVTEILSGNRLHQLVILKNGVLTDLRMKSGEGIRVITKFRYFRLYITQTSGSSEIQFSKLKFATSSGKVFNYWKGSEEKSTIIKYVSCTSNKGSWGANNGERGEYGLLTDVKNGKCCITGCSTINTSNPLILTYDLLNPRLDLNIYTKWYWYTANDTSSYSGRNMTNFKLQVSNDSINWITIDENTDSSNIKTTNNWSLAYENTLNTSEILKNL